MSGNLAHFRLAEFLEEIPDPRIERGKKFSLLEILLTAICAVLSGSEGFNEIAEDGEVMLEWFRSELGLSLNNGIPSHDTYRRVFSLIDPLEFEKAFEAWVRAIHEIIPGSLIAIDGKTLRRAIQNGEEKSALHVITAWASENGLVLGQMKSEGKRNEIRTIPKLLELLKIRGCIVSLDAMGCQTEIAGKITEKGADYVLAVKKNQETLYEQVRTTFERADQRGFRFVDASRYEIHEAGHGREEIRHCDSLSKKEAGKLFRLDIGDHWPKLESICRVIGTRQSPGEKPTTCTRYFISSLAPQAKTLAQAIRSHWGIENEVHWILDVEFREDESRIRKENSPVNFAMIRRLALNLLRADDRPRSLKIKRKRCGWSPAYLLKVLTNQPLGSV